MPAGASDIRARLNPSVHKLRLGKNEILHISKPFAKASVTLVWKKQGLGRQESQGMW